MATVLAAHWLALENVMEKVAGHSVGHCGQSSLRQHPYDWLMAAAEPKAKRVDTRA